MTTKKQQKALPSVAKGSAGKSSSQSFDLDSPEWYLNRELTWLAFNQRVLHEG